MKVLPLVDGDRPWVDALMQERWRAEIVVAHGVVYTPAALNGFVAWEGGRRVGLVTYHLGEGCEIVTIDALEEGRGIGSALLEAGCQGRRARPPLAHHDERQRAGDRLVPAAGFEVVAVHEGAVARSRELKREISLVNPETGIPISDEIEMRRPVRER